MSNKRSFRISSLKYLPLFLLVLVLITAFCGSRQNQLNMSLVAAIKNDDAEAVLSLLDEGANPNAHAELDQNYSTWQVLRSYWETIVNKALGRRSNFPQHTPTVPLLACGYREHTNGSLIKDNPYIIAALIAKGANPNVRDEFGRSALMCEAIANSPVTGIKALLTSRVAINACSMHGVTPLMCTVINSRVEKMQLLLKKGADPNIRDNQGWTALMYAARDGKLECVRALLDSRANVNGKSNEGWTALSLARNNSNLQVIRLLKQAGAK